MKKMKKELDEVPEVLTYVISADGPMEISADHMDKTVGETAGKTIGTLTTDGKVNIRTSQKEKSPSRTPELVIMTTETEQENETVPEKENGKPQENENWYW